jgi:pimeloyl-ACP methyl ester carboxylesterase
MNMRTRVNEKAFGHLRRTALAAILLLIVSVGGMAQKLSLASGSATDVRVSPVYEPARSGPRPQDSQVADKYTTVFGAKIHYLEAGSGPLVDFLDGFYKQLGIQKATLVGNSLGGFTSAAFALAHPEKVDKLVLVDAAGFTVTGDIDPRVLNGLNPSTRQQAKDLIGLIFYNKEPYSSDAAVDAFLASRVTGGDGYTIQRFIDSIGHNEDMLDGKLGAIKHPTLIIWGREDGLTQLAMGQRFNKEIAGSQMLIIEKCGHVPQLEKASEFNAGLMKFLSR